MSEIAEKACAYAALILADESLEITPDKLNTLIQAASLEVETIWTSIFAKALEGKNVRELVTAIGSGAAAAPAAAPSASSAAAPAGGKAEAKKEEKKEEKEESDDDMGFGLFD